MIFETATTRIKTFFSHPKPAAEPVEITDWQRVGLMFNGVRYEWLHVPEMTVVNGCFIGFSYREPPPKAPGFGPIHFKPVKWGAYSPSTGVLVEAV